MAIIESDNAEISRELHRLDTLVAESGGGIHSDLVIFSEGPSLGLRTRAPMARDREIIRLARGSVLPEDKYEVSLKGEEFIATFPKGSNLSTTQRKLAECMMALYTLTGKAAFQEEVSYLYSIAKYPELIDVLVRGRAHTIEFNKWKPQVVEGLTEEKKREYIAQTFLKTRYLGYNDHVRTSSVSVLMPVIDFLNHHWQGASFIVGQGVRKGDLCVGVRQPIEGSLECYAFYNIMDAFDSLIRYDFVDTLAPVVRSVPVELKVENHGVIRVKAEAGMAKAKSLAPQIADLKRYLPFRNLVEPGVLEVSNLMIPVEGSPLALRRILNLVLMTLTGPAAMSAEQRRAWIREAEAAVIEANRAYYEELEGAAQALIDTRGPDPGLERIAHLARTQAAKIQTYVKTIRSYDAKTSEKDDYAVGAEAMGLR